MKNKKKVDENRKNRTKTIDSRNRRILQEQQEKNTRRRIFSFFVFLFFDKTKNIASIEFSINNWTVKKSESWF